MATVVQELAGKRNAASACSFVQDMNRRARSRSRANPKLIYAHYVKDTRSRLDELFPSVKKADSLAAKAKASGLVAEETAGKTVSVLFRMLGSLYARAKSAEDGYALNRVALAANIMKVQIKKGILDMGGYKGTPEQNQEQASRKLESSALLFRDVLNALDNTHKELGVEEPAFPGGKAH